MEVEYELTRTTSTPSSGGRSSCRPGGDAPGATSTSTGSWRCCCSPSLPAIGADGFVISRVNFTFLVVTFPIVFLFQWCLERWLIRRAILQLLKDEKPGKGSSGGTGSS